jgi:hypothetical protein
VLNKYITTKLKIQNLNRKDQRHRYLHPWKDIVKETINRNTNVHETLNQVEKWLKKEKGYVCTTVCFQQQYNETNGKIINIQSLCKYLWEIL